MSKCKSGLTKAPRERSAAVHICEFRGLSCGQGGCQGKTVGFLFCALVIRDL